MGNFDADARHQTAQLGSQRLQSAYSVADIVNSAAAAQLTLQRLLNHAVVIFADIGFNRQTVLRRRFDNAHITAVDQRHMQSTRNRCCRKRQNIYAEMPFLDFFLLGNAKALLLIDNQQAEAGKIHIRLQQTVRADKNIHLTVGNLLQNSALLLRRTKTV